MEKQEEAGTSGGARCWEFGVSLSLKPTVLEPFRILCLFLTPTRESTQQQSHPGHFAQWKASLGCYTAPLPPPGTFSKLHPFCTKLFAE